MACPVVDIPAIVVEEGIQVFVEAPVEDMAR